MGDLFTNKILAGAIVALLAWNIATTHSISVSVAVIQEKVMVLQQDVNRLRGQINVD